MVKKKREKIWANANFKTYETDGGFSDNSFFFVGPPPPHKSTPFASVRILFGSFFESPEMDKQPLDLDWDEHLPRRRQPPPPPEEAEATSFPVSELSDHELQEKIKRLEKAITIGLSDKLPDKGRKLRSVHQHCCNELDRRNLARIQKVAFF